MEEVPRFRFCPTTSVFSFSLMTLLVGLALGKAEINGTKEIFVTKTKLNESMVNGMQSDQAAAASRQKFQLSTRREYSGYKVPPPRHERSQDYLKSNNTQRESVYVSIRPVYSNAEHPWCGYPYHCKGGSLCQTTYCPVNTYCCRSLLGVCCYASNHTMVPPTYDTYKPSVYNYSPPEKSPQQTSYKPEESLYYPRPYEVPPHNYYSQQMEPESYEEEYSYEEEIPRSPFVPNYFYRRQPLPTPRPVTSADPPPQFKYRSEPVIYYTPPSSQVNYPEPMRHSVLGAIPVENEGESYVHDYDPYASRTSNYGRYPRSHYRTRQPYSNVQHLPTPRTRLRRSHPLNYAYYCPPCP